VGHGAGAALLHGQAGMGAVERLDLALLIDAEHQRLVGRIELEPDHVLHLGGEVLIARDFEGLDQVRLEPVRMPYPLDTAVRDARRRGHAAYAPVGRIRRLLKPRHVHHLVNLLHRQHASRAASQSQRRENVDGSCWPASQAWLPSSG
jgi:hypothetical protein